MLTPKQEQYCRNREIKKLSQRHAYIEAYPTSKNWKPKTVDEAACRLEKNSKITARLEELRQEEKEQMQQEAKWTREDAFEALKWMLDNAKKEVTEKGEFTGPCVSAITNATKELNAIYAVGAETKGKGVLEDILDAVRGADND